MSSGTLPPELKNCLLFHCSNLISSLFSHSLWTFNWAKWPGTSNYIKSWGWVTYMVWYCAFWALVIFSLWKKASVSIPTYLYVSISPISMYIIYIYHLYLWCCCSIGILMAYYWHTVISETLPQYRFNSPQSIQGEKCPIRQEEYLNSFMFYYTLQNCILTFFETEWKGL